MKNYITNIASAIGVILIMAGMLYPSGQISLETFNCIVYPGMVILVVSRIIHDHKKKSK